MADFVMKVIYPDVSIHNRYTPRKDSIMQIINRPASLVAAAILGLTFSASSIAQGGQLEKRTETGKMQGPAAASPANSSASKDSMKAAKADYKAAMAKCKEVTGAERRTCRKDAKAAQKASMSNARGMSDTGAMGKTGKAAGPAGSTKPLGGQ
jgi:hypothetical protein